MGKRSLPNWSCGSKKPFVDFGKIHMLEFLVKKYKLKHVAEIGVFTGGLTGRVIRGGKGIIEKYYCVDPWKPYPESYDREPRPEEITDEYWDKIYNRIVGMANNNSQLPIVKVIGLSREA